MTFADVHIHALSGVDDGAHTDEEMYEIIDQAYISGTRVICCTPHFHPGYFGNNKESSESAFQKLNHYVRENYQDLELYLGNELRYATNACEWLQNGECRTLNNTRFVLVDFAENESERTIVNALHCIQNSGYSPVLAHAERYRTLHGKFRLFREFHDNGIILQADTQSLFGGFGFRVQHQCKKMLAEHLIDMICSDAHNCSSRPAEMDEAFNWLKQKHGVNYAVALCRNNAQKLIHGEL